MKLAPLVFGTVVYSSCYDTYVVLALSPSTLTPAAARAKVAVPGADRRGFAPPSRTAHSAGRVSNTSLGLNSKQSGREAKPSHWGRASSRSRGSYHQRPGRPLCVSALPSSLGGRKGNHSSRKDISSVSRTRGSPVSESSWSRSAMSSRGGASRSRSRVAMSEEGNAGETERKSPSLLSWIILGSLLLVSVNNQLSRSLIYYVVDFGAKSTPEAAKEFMNVALGFDQGQYSFLASFGFTLLYSVCSLFAGRLVDVWSKTAALVVPCVVWSLATISQGFAGSFGAVLGIRVTQGLAQAFTSPVSYTLISDIFPASVRSTANSIFSSGVYLGGALASLTVALNSRIGWRQSSIIIGATGLATALLTLVLVQGKTSAGEEEQQQEQEEEEEDKKKGKKEGHDLGMQESLQQVLSNKTAALVFAAGALRFCAGYGIAIWSAPYFRQAYPSFTDQYAFINAFVVAGGGVLSSFLGGFLADKFKARDPRVRAWVPMVGSLLAVPTWMGVVSGFDFYTSLAFLFAEYLVAECWFGPTVTILQEAVPLEMRGTAQGIFSTLITVGNLAPLLMGLLQEKGGVPLQTVLFWTVPFFYAASAFLFYLVGQSLLETSKQQHLSAKKMK